MEKACKPQLAAHFFGPPKIKPQRFFFLQMYAGSLLASAVPDCTVAFVFVFSSSRPLFCSLSKVSFLTSRWGPLGSLQVPFGLLSATSWADPFLALFKRPADFIWAPFGLPVFLYLGLVWFAFGPPPPHTPDSVQSACSCPQTAYASLSDSLQVRSELSRGLLRPHASPP